MYRKIISVVLAILLFAGVVSPTLLFTTVHADTLYLAPEADLLSVGDYIGTDDMAQQLYVGTTELDDAVQPSRAALRFNLGMIPGTATKYELRLTLAGVETTNGNENVFYIDAWGSPNDTMTDNDIVFPSYQTDGPTVRVSYYDMPSPRSDWVLPIDVTSIVNAQTNATDRNVTIVLTGNESLIESARIISYSKEATEGLRPQLVVTYEENQPPTGSIEIAGGTLYTNTTSVNLNLTNSDPNGDSVEMRLSNDGADWSEWEAAAATRSWTLTTGDGLKTVYYQLRDSSNAESVIYQDTITLDTIPPKITGVTQGGLYTTDITITSDEGTATLNGIPFVLGGKVSTDGNYTLVVRDSAGNTTTISFTVDKTPPAVSGVVNGVSYNTDRKITFTEGNALLNDQPYTSGTTINAEGSYTLVVSDAAGNTTTINFTIDKTKPVVSGVEDGKLYNTDKTVTFDEGVATLNGKPFTSGDTISQDGDYTLIVTDAAGNSSTVSFSLDKTPPTVTGVTDGSHYNTDRTITFTEGNALLNDQPYTSGTLISEEGSYTLVVSDAAGNATTISFTIDKTKPVVSGVEDGKLYNTDKTVTFDEGVATLNGKPFTSGDTISQDGDYTLIVTDAAGNSSTVSFSLDKTPPTVTGVTDGSHYNTDRTITFTEGNALLNDQPYTSGTLISEEGSYTLVVSDAAGNAVTISFTIDKTKPVVSGVEDGKLYNTDKTVTFDEGVATLNGKPFTSGDTISQDGDYTLIVTDAAGNSSTVSFSLDKTPPTVTGVTDGSHYNTDRTITFTEGNALLNDQPYTSGTLISEEGSYTLVVSDAAGNATTISFTIDKTKPVVTGVEDGKLYNADRTVTFDEGAATLNGETFTSGDIISQEGDYTLIVTDAAGNSITVSFSLDKTPPIVTGVTDGSHYNTDRTVTFTEGNALLNDQPYTSGTTISEEGSYTLAVRDAAGNAVTISFTIDKTKPVVSGVEDGKLYNADRTVTFDEGAATLNGETFTSGDIISQEGDYTLIVTDAAGNSITVSFSLDKTPPTVTGVTDGSHYNTDQTISFSEGTATLNGESYTSGTNVSEEGSYTLVVTDNAGNETKVSFKIDKTKPVISGVSDQGEYKTAVTVTFNEGTATLNGNPFTTGSTISNGGKFTLIVTDEAGNQTSVVFTITLATSSPGGGTGGNGSAGNTGGYGNNSNNSNDGNGAEQSKTTIVVIVNGQDQKQIAEAHIEMKDGKSVTVVSIDEQKLDDNLQKEPLGATVVIPIHSTVNGVTELNGRMVKAMGNKAVTLQIQLDQATYTIPAKEINIDKISKAIGNSVALEDIKLNLSVTQASDKDVQLLTKGLGAATRIAPAVHFSITATYNGKEVEIDQFNSFVERSITIPDNVDPKKITTGVVLTKDGKVAHIPTKVETRSGKSVAIINSLTNSVYSVIYNEKTFADITHHWARAGIEDMSARMIIEGVNDNQFMPDQGITRAEFTAILVRALGLHLIDKSVSFRDVNESNWFYESVSVGSSYGLVEGFKNGEFLPNQKITREEAAVLLFRAMNLAHMDTSISENESVRILGAFKDDSHFHEWSKTAAALNVKFHILTGFNGMALPKQQITRAETAVMIQRLLQQAGLI